MPERSVFTNAEKIDFGEESMAEDSKKSQFLLVSLALQDLRLKKPLGRHPRFAQGFGRKAGERFFLIIRFKRLGKVTA